ncbi:E3 SUMO-protein ligase PIAS2-like isoform X3 [Mizuhopecten yessoensis]|uniref:E3 SUMO-protein ligase PIAS2-like isoform X3 n=1 Tax=Mizuhopecten yessoensis TaxID=6573 RepID=UPI000B4576DA|nr:E3 SUMO-protein ligase PIAS2-like isoform X3 [Mizuhopecten yessoensis]
MADTSELKHMVMSFRVSELQVLLGYAGRNKTGRKQELLQRAIQLVQKGASVPIQIKIRELYKRKVPGRNEDEGLPGGYNIFGGHGSSATDRADSCREKPSIKSPVKSEGPRYRGSRPMDYSTAQRMVEPPSTMGIPVHPDVRLKHLPFYDCITELMKPTSLVPRGTSKFQETHFNFHLTPQQAQDIAMSRDFRPGAKYEFITQIQLRFSLLETTCEQDDNFPPNICVRINGKMAPLPNPIPTTKPGVEPKRPGRPVDITPQCRLSPTMANQVEISWATDFNRGYCVAIYLVKRLSSDTLLQRLKQFGSRHADHTRALIKEKLAHDQDSEIATTSLRVSLLCPLGKMRITIPIRASSCTHLQTFDAITFLMMNEKKPTWMCPVCDKIAPFHKLFIDGLFVEILKEATDDEIQFTEDGNWCHLQRIKETHVIPSPIIKKPAATVVADTSESPTKRPKMDVIDLTEDSSDEDGPSGFQSSSHGYQSTGCVSPPVISLDSPTPAPSSISSTESPLVSSPCSNSSSYSASTSPSASPGASSSTTQPLSAPTSPLRHSPSPSPIHSPSSQSSHSEAPSSHSDPQSPTDSQESPHSSPRSTHTSPQQSPIGVRVSPVTPPSSAPSFPPFQPFQPPVHPMNYPHYQQISNFDPDFDEFLRGIVPWDQYR